VLVHGFRPQVNDQLKAKNHPARYRHGIRVTDEVALDCAQEAAGQLRFEIEAAFSQGLPNTPMANATVRVVSGRGSVFWLCALASRDPAFTKYPRLPVLRCAGHQPKSTEV